MNRLLFAVTVLASCALPGLAWAQVCGDSVIDTTEACDDGGTATGDGCDAGCAVEAGWLCAGPFDTTAFTMESYGAPPWGTSTSGSAAFGTDGNPGVVLGNIDPMAGPISFEVEVTTVGDDDFVGFVLGMNAGDSTNAAADYLLVDWKQADQFVGVQGFEGLALSTVSGVPTFNDFWSHTGALTEIARGATLGSTGWSDNTPHLFVVDYTASTLQVWVDGSLELDLTGSFPSGSFGFYDYSQSGVVFTRVTDDVSECTETCGDGVLTSGEACDDGNGNVSDGCSPSCAVETGWTCAGDPSVCDGLCGDESVVGAEACDDGGVLPGDGCDAACQIEAGFDCTGPFNFNLGAPTTVGNSGNWTVAADGLSATETVNGNASFYVVPIQSSVVGSFTFEITVNTTADDDYFGVALGLDPGELGTAGADFLLIDWKQAVQIAFGAAGQSGLAVSRVLGPATDGEYWGHTGAPDRSWPQKPAASYRILTPPGSRVMVSSTLPSASRRSSSGRCFQASSTAARNRSVFTSSLLGTALRAGSAAR